MDSIIQLFSWKGRVTRSQYLGSALILLAIKYNLDRFFITSFWNFPVEPLEFGWMRIREKMHEPEFPIFCVYLLAMSIPFAWLGVCLTLRRLRDAEWTPWLTVVLVLPLVNLLFAAVLCLIPTHDDSGAEFPIGTSFRKYVPTGDFGAALAAILLTVPAAVLLVWAGTQLWTFYGWGLFVGTPFFLGFASALIAGVHRPRTLWECLTVATWSIIITGLILLAVALEGVICLLMALPIGVGAAWVGAWVGYAILKASWGFNTNARLVLGAPMLVAATMGFEAVVTTEPPLTKVVTSVEIGASPERVWPNVIQFRAIPKPDEWIFKTGIAYPTDARIDGSGVGAVRHCNFSTGPFVEPITVWDAPNVLAFNVTSQPACMDEISPWHDIEPSHVRNYLVSERGELRLIRLPDGRTRLQGTTWYRHHIWPSAYWKVYSEYLIHAIHRRVLGQIKNVTES